MGEGKEVALLKCLGKCALQLAIKQPGAIVFSVFAVIAQHGTCHTYLYTHVFIKCDGYD